MAGLNQSPEEILKAKFARDGWPTNPDEPQVETPTEEPKEEPKAEEPKVEPIVEPKVETPAEPAVETPAEIIDWEARFKEKELEISKLTEELNKPKESEFANDYIKKLNEVAKSGIDFNEEFWQMQNLDLDKYSSSNKDDMLALMKLELKVSNKELTDAHVDRYFRKNYPALYDELLTPEDRDYKDSMLDLDMDFRKARTRLAEYKSKIQLPTVNLEEREKQAKAQEEWIKNFNQSVKTEVSSYNEQPFKVGDLELKFSVDNESKKVIESMMINNDKFFEPYFNEDRSVNIGKLKKDMLILSNFDKIIKMAHDQGVSSGREMIADKLENADVETSARQVPEEVDLRSKAIEEIRRRQGF